MTEGEWLTCDDPTALLDGLRDRASDRKWRLFAAAYARRLLPRMGDERCPGAVEVAERLADGLAGEGERDVAYRLADGAVLDAVADADFERAYLVVYPKRCLEPARGGVVRLDHQFHPWEPADVRLVRCIFGNPFRPAVVDPAWQTSTVLAFAGGIYESRDFTALPIVADALQDAGCENADILDHCRGPGPHVRGCWVIDMLLGKG